MIEKCCYILSFNGIHGYVPNYFAQNYVVQLARPLSLLYRILEGTLAILQGSSIVEV